MPMEPGEELFNTLLGKCTGCGLLRRQEKIPTQGIPRKGTILHGGSFYGRNCLRCGVETVEVLNENAVPAAAATPPQGWTKIPTE